MSLIDEIPVILGCMVREFLDPRFRHLGIDFNYEVQAPTHHWPVIDIYAVKNGQKEIAFRFRLELDCSNNRSRKKELIIGRKMLSDLHLAARDLRILFSSLGFEVREGDLT